MNAGRKRLRALSALACVAVATQLRAQSAVDTGSPKDKEEEIGQQVFKELRAKGEIIESSPLYDLLLPVIEPILRTAQPRYAHPFKVYLVHEAQPNAFATPGGGIYVTDALLYFARNKEELAGTLCHEVAHTIHHDSITLLRKKKLIEAGEVGAAILVGPTRAHVLAIALLGHLRSLSYSRQAEARADLTGADLCAAAGSNPWGLVWLFRDFKNARAAEMPALLSDHPNDQARIDALEQHFRGDAAAFGRFDPKPESATQFAIPKAVPVLFLR